MACCEARENETGGDFAEAVISSKMRKFVELRGVVSCDLTCPEGTTRYCGVEYVGCGVVDGALGRVTYSERDR